MASKKKLMSRQITDMKVAMLKILRGSPFVHKYDELIALEEKEGRKVVQQIINSKESD